MQTFILTSHPRLMVLVPENFVRFFLMVNFMFGSSLLRKTQKNIRLVLFSSYVRVSKYLLYKCAFIGETMYFFHFNDIYIFIYENTAEMGLPTGHPSICFMKLLLTENAHSVVHFNNNFLLRRWIRTRTHYFINFMFIKIY